MVGYSREEHYTKPKNVREFLEIVLHKENGAVRFYKDMLKYSFAQDKSIAELINKLKGLEEMHVKMVEKKIAEID